MVLHVLVLVHDHVKDLYLNDALVHGIEDVEDLHEIVIQENLQ